MGNDDSNRPVIGLNKTEREQALKQYLDARKLQKSDSRRMLQGTPFVFTFKEKGSGILSKSTKNYWYVGGFIPKDRNIYWAQNLVTGEVIDLEIRELPPKSKPSRAEIDSLKETEKYRFNLITNTQWLIGYSRLNLIAKTTTEGQEIETRWVVLEKIGSGGQGAVYIAQNIETREIIAVKEISVKADTANVVANRLAIAAEKKALEILGRLKLDVAVNGAHYLGMPYLEGLSLKAYIESLSVKSRTKEEQLRRCGTGQHFSITELEESVSSPEVTTRCDSKKTLESIVDVLLQLVRALEQLQNSAVVHADFHPENIMLCENAAVPFDFGLSFIAGQYPNIGFAGTKGFSAPELAAKYMPDHSHHVDLFSFGVIVYLMLFPCTYKAYSEQLVPGQSPSMTSDLIQDFFNRYISPFNNDDNYQRLLELAQNLVVDDPNIRWDLSQVRDQLSLVIINQTHSKPLLPLTVRTTPTSLQQYFDGFRSNHELVDISRYLSLKDVINILLYLCDMGEKEENFNLNVILSTIQITPALEVVSPIEYAGSTSDAEDKIDQTDESLNLSNFGLMVLALLFPHKFSEIFLIANGEDIVSHQNLLSINVQAIVNVILDKNQSVYKGVAYINLQTLIRQLVNSSTTIAWSEIRKSLESCQGLALRTLRRTDGIYGGYGFMESPSRSRTPSTGSETETPESGASVAQPQGMS